MSISIWDLFKYLYKWKIVIIAVTILSLLAASFYVNEKQTYTAKVVIQFLDPCIARGETPDGGKFDSNEIKSPVVILNVLKELGYEQKKIDSVREKISISPITPSSAESLKEAKEKLGEEYSYYPTAFTVTYKGDSSYEATRDILSSVITNYLKYYTERYLYLAALNEVDYNLNNKNFDYLEQAEQLQENVKQTISALQGYEKDSASYRSPNTGLTFDDLLKEFQRLDEHTIPLIFSKIFEAQLSQNKALLINKYTERMEQNERDAENNLYKAELAKDRMDAYVKSTTKVENEALELVEEEERVAVQTTYDQLITNYASDSISANNNKIDADYCRVVIGRFTGAPSGNVDYEKSEQFVQDKIAEVLEQLKVLYQKANTNTADYNAYIPAHHIKKLSGVGYFENISGALYKLIALFVGFGLSCAFAIMYEIMRKYAAFQATIQDESETSDSNDEEPEGASAEPQEA